MNDLNEDLLWMALCARLSQRMVDILRSRNLPTVPPDGERLLTPDAAVVKLSSEIFYKCDWWIAMVRKILGDQELNRAIQSLDPHIDSVLDTVISLGRMKLEPNNSVEDLLWIAWNHGQSGVPRVLSAGENEFVHFKSWYRSLFETQPSQQNQLQHDPVQ